MNELTTQEMEQTSGGIWPIVGLALAVAGKTTASGPVGWAVGSASVVLASYQFAEAYWPQPAGQQATGGYCPVP
ncbi:MAG: class IIb bacteriocin, lactobin A/cerein 7B family [Gammaproteobacteria bacterium]|nr:class IIb bacteriocin, lactobin A/cerein 7B family [Gammaproteobacteria bacterium]